MMGFGGLIRHLPAPALRAATRRTCLEIQSPHLLMHGRGHCRLQHTHHISPLFRTTRTTYPAILHTGARQIHSTAILAILPPLPMPHTAIAWTPCDILYITYITLLYPPPPSGVLREALPALMWEHPFCKSRFK